MDRRGGHGGGGRAGGGGRGAHRPRPARHPGPGPTGEGTLGDASTAWLAGLAAVAALLATGLPHLLLLTTPRPGRFFGWIVALVTVIAAILPFMTDAELGTQVATAAIYLAVGLTIGSLLSGVGRSAMRVR